MIVTPIKIQGKKTKIISNIVELAKINDNTTWVEPFLGSGEVLFNINPKKAYVSDNNEYVINFYNNIKNKKITSEIVRTFLEKHGKNLEQNGEEYYYKMRDEFNKNHDALYFLFLNRSCFNGIIRFNSKNEFNVPFCKKNNRYSKSMITKIVNQANVPAIKYAFNSNVNNVQAANKIAKTNAGPKRHAKNIIIAIINTNNISKYFIIFLLFLRLIS